MRRAFAAGHRLSHDKRGTVYAYKNELDSWWECRRTALSVDASEPEVGQTASPKAIGFEPPDARRSRGPMVRRKMLGGFATAFLALAGSHSDAQVQQPAPPPIRQVDHVMIRT